MNPDHRKAIHAAIDQAINRGMHLSVGFHPRTISDEGTILSGISALAHPNPWALEFQQGERHGWWQVDSSTAHVVVHQAQDRSPEPVVLDRTQVDRTVPYKTPVTVATTQPDFAARLAASLKRNAAALEGLAKADDAGWGGYYRAGIE